MYNIITYKFLNFPVKISLFLILRKRKLKKKKFGRVIPGIKLSHLILQKKIRIG